MKIKTILYIGAFVVVSLSSAIPATSQVTTGAPYLGSFGGGPDVINLGNLNINWTFPMINKPGRGIPFVLAPTLDSSIWYPVTSGSSKSWQPINSFGWGDLPSKSGGGYVTYSTPSPQEESCGPPPDEEYIQFYTNFVYVDAKGTPHPFNLSPYYVYPVNQCTNQTQGSGPLSASAADGSGYTLKVNPMQNGVSTWVSSSNGMGTAPSTSGVGSQEDLNGNWINCTTSSCTDTLGVNVMSVSGTYNNPPVTITANGPGGSGTVTYTIKFSSYTVRTHFNCSSPAVSEYGPISVSLPYEIDLPDGRKYSIGYEATPGYTGDVTGRVASITLPSDTSGSTIQYVYSGGGSGVNGISCSDGSTPSLQRTTPDGTWTYARNTAGTVTTVTAPSIAGSADQTQIEFGTITTSGVTNFYETGREMFTGSVSSGTLMETTLTCYSNTITGCPTTYAGAASESVNLSARAITNQFPNSSGISSGFIDQYDGYGNVDVHAVYDFGSAGSGTFATTATYIHQTNYLVSTGATDSSTGILVGGIDQAQQDYIAYPGTGGAYVPVYFVQNYYGSATQSSGAPHRSPGAGSLTPSNLTSSYQWISGGNPITGGISGTNYLESVYTYYDTGVPYTAEDPNGAVTTYSYGSASCGYAFPTSVSTQTGSRNLSTSAAWNCSGGVQSSSTDVNSNTTNYSYGSDPYWRTMSATNSSTDQTTSYTYPSGSSETSSTAMSFYEGSSTNTTETTYDRLGRPVLQQTLESPGWTNYDTVATTYDARGRTSTQSLPYSGTLGESITSGPGVTTTYDALNRTHSVTDAGGGSVQYSYNGNDVLITVGPAPSGENTKSRNLQYNGAGWLTSVCEVTSGTSTYPGGACGQTYSQTGYLTEYTYDAAGRLTKTQQDAQPNNKGVQTRTVVYDGMGRKTQETIPEWSAGTGSAGTSYYTYDSVTSGNCAGTYKGDMIMSQDAAGNVTCYTYDLQHRPLSTKVASGPYADPTTPQSHFVYDAATLNGNGMQNALGALAEAYTCTGSCGTKLTDVFMSTTPVSSGQFEGGAEVQMWESTPHSGGYFNTQDTYYPNGALGNRQVFLGTSSIGFPNVTYGLDGEGRPFYASDATRCINPVTAATYTPASSPANITFGNASTGTGADVDSFQYDPNTNRPVGLEYRVNASSAAFQVNTSLAWNANGSLQTMGYTDTNDSTKNQNCTYSADDLGRIASVGCGSSTWAQTFSYDSFGNINKAGQGNATSYSYAYTEGTNQVSGGPAYDANGNQLNSTGLSQILWNANGQPRSVTPLSGGAISGTYDALGRLVENGSGSAYTQFVFSPSGQKIASVQGGTLIKATVPLPGGATAIYSGTSGMPYIRHLDWLGSARLSTTWSHTVQSKVAYAPFGETYNEAGASSNDRSFTGQEQDTVTGSPATGIYDFMFRKYDPAAGRWLSPDPSGWNAVDQNAPQSLDRYAYVLNDPLALTDPNGLSCVYGYVEVNGVSVSVPSDDGDGKGCAAAGVPPSPDGGSGNDGTPGVVVNANDPCRGNPNCVVVTPPPADCGILCQIQYQNAIWQLSTTPSNQHGTTPNSGGDFNGNSMNFLVRKPTGQCATTYNDYVSAADKINGDAWGDGWAATIAGCIAGPDGCLAGVGFTSGWSAVHPGTEHQQIKSLYDSANAKWQAAGCGSNMHNPLE